MNLILGFGKTEEDFEQKQFDFVESFLREKHKKDYEFFSDELIAELKSLLKKRGEEYRETDKSYKDAVDFPERYSYFYENVISDGCDLCVVFSFTHTNRRHPMSPDGWACISGKKVYHAYYGDFTK